MYIIFYIYLANPSLLMAAKCSVSVWTYLTRSITLSLGAELTGSSLIMMISSPGVSLPSEGPPADTQHKWREAAKRCVRLVPIFRIIFAKLEENSWVFKRRLYPSMSNCEIINQFPTQTMAWLLLTQRLLLACWMTVKYIHPGILDHYLSSLDNYILCLLQQAAALLQRHKRYKDGFKTGVNLHSAALPVELCLVLALGFTYLVWLSEPPPVFHCLLQIQNQARDPVSSPPSWELVAQTCPRPGEPPPGSCSGTRDCYKDNETQKMCYYFPRGTTLYFCLIMFKSIFIFR